MEVHPLRKARKAAGLKAKELAEMSNLSAATVSRIETRKRGGTIETFRALGNALGVDWRELVEG